MNSSLPVLGMLHPLGAARLLAGLLLLAAAAGQSDLPLPRRCHLAAPCTATRGCEPLVGGREAWVAGGEGVEVQLGVVCIAQGGSRLYGTAAFFTYEIRAPGSQQLLQQGKFNQYDLGLHAHVSNTVSRQHQARVARTLHILPLAARLADSLSPYLSVCPLRSCVCRWASTLSPCCRARSKATARLLPPANHTRCMLCQPRRRRPWRWPTAPAAQVSQPRRMQERTMRRLWTSPVRSSGRAAWVARESRR